MEIIRLVGDLTAGRRLRHRRRPPQHPPHRGGRARRSRSALGGIDLYSEEHVVTTLTEVNVALHAHVLLQRDVHYIVRDGAVHLINASRGRIAQLQRWPDGLQAAVEAKEGIETTETGEVLDTITVQALINRYPTVCGMTGTALAAGEQLRQFYKLGVSPIPPNTPNIREDEADRVYITAAAKNDAIIDHIDEVHATGQPVLVGTRDVAESEELHERLVKARRPGGRAQRQERRRGGRRHRRGRQAGHGDGVDPDGRPRHRHPAGRLRRGRPRRGRRTRRAARRRHRPAPHRAAGQPAARPRRTPGRPGLVGVLLQLGGRRGGGAPRVRASCPPRPTRTAGSSAPRPPRLLDHAQRVAEGRLLDVHANTWRYNQLIAQQRAIIVERRNTLLRTATAREELAELSPERYEELSETLCEEQLREICRLIMLYHLDRGWADHLAYLADIRESIHLRALGRQNPLDEFHRMAVDAFASLAADAIEAAQQTFETAERRSRTSRAWTCRSWPARRRRGRTWCTTTRCGRHAVGAEPARGVPLGCVGRPDRATRLGLWTRRTGTRATGC